MSHECLHLPFSISICMSHLAVPVLCWLINNEHRKYPLGNKLNTILLRLKTSHFKTIFLPVLFQVLPCTWIPMWLWNWKLWTCPWRLLNWQRFTPPDMARECQCCPGEIDGSILIVAFVSGPTGFSPHFVHFSQLTLVFLIGVENSGNSMKTRFSHFPLIF